MEELLNKLIEKGWRPFKIKDNMHLYCFKDNKILISYYYFDTEWECNHEDKRCDYRQLTSKESWLWQFVCENKLEKKMEKIPRGIWINSWSKSAYEKCPVYTMEKVEYRIIESALCNEEDLEKFLLDNIKV